MKESLTIVLITSNEETRIEKFLKAHGWADEIIVVDGCSSDRTCTIAKAAGALVYQRAFDDFASQKNYGVQQATCDWVLSLDVDEYVTKDLKNSIFEMLAKTEKKDGYYLIRRNYIFGKVLHYGNQRVDRTLRLFRKNKGRFEQPIHEKLKLQGSAGELAGLLDHETLPTIGDYFKKLELYTSFEAQWLLKQGKTSHWYHFNLFPLSRFIYYYFIRFGFLDGYEGFLYHCLSSFYFFFKYAKLKELETVAKRETVK